MEDDDSHTDNEQYLCKAFYNMKNKLDKLFADYEKKLLKKGRKKKEKTKDIASINLGNGGDPT